MFYLLSILSPIGYGTQITFLAHISRKIDALDMTFYRSVSFFITLLPLLLFTSAKEIAEVVPFLPQFFLVGFLALASMWGRFKSFRYLPVGVSGSVRRVMVTILVLPLSFIFLDEIISWQAGILIALAIGAVIYLGQQKNHLEHLDSNTMKGILLLLVTAIPSSLNTFLVAKMARELNPFVVAYFWETIIGVAAGLFLMLRYFFTRKKFHWIGIKKASRIGLAASPTLLGSGAFVWAASLGSLAIVSSIGLFSIVVSTLMSHYIYHEKLTKKQWLGMVVCVLAVLGLKFVAG